MYGAQTSGGLTFTEPEKSIWRMRGSQVRAAECPVQKLGTLSRDTNGSVDQNRDCGM